MDENFKTIIKMRSNQEFSNNPLGPNIPKESNNSNRVQEEKIIHNLNNLKCKYESKLNLDKVIKNIYLNTKNSKEKKSKDDHTSENHKIEIPKKYSDNKEKSYIASLIYNSNKKKNKRKIINNNLKFLGNKVLMIL